MLLKKIASTEGMGEIPYIDPRVEHVGVSRLRQLNKRSLKSDLENKTLVISEQNKSLAVLLGYEQYLIMQNQLRAVMETVELFSDAEEMKLLLSGMAEVAEGKTRSLDEIRRSLGHQSGSGDSDH